VRVAVVSDIHGNCVALDAVLADIDRMGITEGVCLGDAIQGGPQPTETAARLRELGWPVVMGNSDAWLLSGTETGNEKISPQRWARLIEGRNWALGRLSGADRAYIAGFPATVTVPLGTGRSLLCFHGSPASFDDFVLPRAPDEEFLGFLAPYAEQILTGGHTHVQFVRRIGLGETFFFNPGSVGVAYAHGHTEATLRLDPWAEYAILTAEGGLVSLEFRKVPFDVPALVQVYRTSGHPGAADAISRYSPTSGAEASAG
jgi:predicted phosphodiesterase